MTSTTAASRRAPSITAWRNAVFVVFTVNGLSIATWLGRVPTVRDSLGATTFEMGLLVLGMSIGSITGLTVAGHIVSRLGARHSAQIASTCFAIGMVIAGVAVSAGWGFAGVFVCLILFGFGNGLLDVSMNVSGATAERLGGRSVMPLFHASFSLGTLLGAGIGAFAEAVRIPVVLQFSVTGVVMWVVIMTALRWFGEERLIPEPTDTSPIPQVAQVSRWAVWAMPGTILIGLIVLGMALAEGSANDWLALAMVDGHGLSNAGGSAVLSVFVASMTVGRIAGVFVLDRFGRVPVLRASAALAVIGLAMLIFVPNVPIAIVGVVLWGMGASLGFPVGMSAAADDPKLAAVRVSAVATVGYLAFLAGPPLIGFVGGLTGLLHGLLVVFVFIIVAGLASPAAREVVRRTASAAPAPAPATPGTRDGKFDAYADPADATPGRGSQEDR
jgi:MFS family permease